MFSFREFANKLSLALLSNSNIPLQKLDLSHNPLEDKGELLVLSGDVQGGGGGFGGRATLVRCEGTDGSQ